VTVYARPHDQHSTLSLVRDLPPSSMAGYVLQSYLKTHRGRLPRVRGVGRRIRLWQVLLRLTRFVSYCARRRGQTSPITCLQVPDGLVPAIRWSPPTIRNHRGGARLGP